MSAAGRRCVRTSTRCTTPSRIRDRIGPACRCCHRPRPVATCGQVRDEVLEVVSRAPLNSTALTRAGFAFGMVVQHEQQHDETMLATHQLRSSGGPLAAALGATAALRPAAGRGAGAGRSVQHGYLDRGLGAGQRAAGARRRGRRLLIDTTPVSNGRVPGVPRRRRLPATGVAGRRPAGRTVSRPTWWRRCSGTRDGDGTWWRRGFGSLVEPDLDRAGGARLPVRGAGLRGLGRPAAADRGRSGRRRLAGIRPPAGPAATRGAIGIPTAERANLGQRQLSPAPVGSYPDGASPLGRAPADRRCLGVDVLDVQSLSGLPGVPVCRSTRRSSSASSTRCCAAARSAPIGRPAGAPSGTGTIPIRRQIFAGFRTARDAGPADRAPR